MVDLGPKEHPSKPSHCESISAVNELAYHHWAATYRLRMERISEAERTAGQRKHLAKPNQNVSNRENGRPKKKL